MGMTNEQFDSYKTMLLRRLEKALKKIKNATEEEKEDLVELIEDLRKELQKP